MSTIEATTQVTTDLSDEEAIEQLFQPPVEISGNDEWTARFHAVVRRLQRDASGLPMDMAQKMLIERIASTYIRTSWYQTNGGMNERALGELNKLYLSYVTQFQRVLQASDEVLRQDLVKKFSAIVTEIPKMIENDDDRKTVWKHIRDEFAALGF